MEKFGAKQVVMLAVMFLFISATFFSFAFIFGGPAKANPSLSSDFTVTHIAAGGAHSLVIGEDGNIWSFGNNNVGQLGIGATSAGNAFPQRTSGNRQYSALAAGWDFSFGVATSDSRMWAWGSNTGVSDGRSHLGIGSRDTPFPSPINGDGHGAAQYTAVAAGREHAIGLRSNNTLWSWGTNNYGQLGEQSGSSNPDNPYQVGSRQYKAISTAPGGYHNLALDMNDQLWVWGSGANGRLGNNSTVNAASTVQHTGEHQIRRYKKIAAGASHSLALDMDGHLWVWGLNSNGQLGNGQTGSSLEPIRHQAALTCNVSNIDCTSPSTCHYHRKYVEIAAGGSHSMAIDEDGYIWVWGNNGNGRLGTGGVLPTPAPSQSLIPMRQTRSSNCESASVDCNKEACHYHRKYQTLSAGDAHSMAIDEIGHLWVWGLNSNGRLGDGSATDKYVPQEIFLAVPQPYIELISPTVPGWPNLVVGQPLVSVTAVQNEFQYRTVGGSVPGWTTVITNTPREAYTLSLPYGSYTLEVRTFRLTGSSNYEYSDIQTLQIRSSNLTPIWGNPPIDGNPATGGTPVVEVNLTPLATPGYGVGNGPPQMKYYWTTSTAASEMPTVWNTEAFFTANATLMTGNSVSANNNDTWYIFWAEDTLGNRSTPRWVRVTMLVSKEMFAEKLLEAMKLSPEDYTIKSWNESNLDFLLSSDNINNINNLFDTNPLLARQRAVEFFNAVDTGIAKLVNIVQLRSVLTEYQSQYSPNANLYTLVSWQRLVAAVDDFTVGNVREIRVQPLMKPANELLTQTMANNRHALIRDAINRLVRISENDTVYKELDKERDRFAALNGDDYSILTWGDLEAAIDRNRDIGPRSEREDIIRATNEIRSAINALVNIVQLRSVMSRLSYLSSPAIRPLYTNTSWSGMVAAINSRTVPGITFFNGSAYNEAANPRAITTRTPVTVANTLATQINNDINGNLITVAWQDLQDLATSISREYYYDNYTIETWDVLQTQLDIVTRNEFGTGICVDTCVNTRYCLHVIDYILGTPEAHFEDGLIYLINSRLAGLININILRLAIRDARDLARHPTIPHGTGDPNGNPILVPTSQARPQGLYTEASWRVLSDSLSSPFGYLTAVNVRNITLAGVPPVTDPDVIGRVTCNMCDITYSQNSDGVRDGDPCLTQYCTSGSPCLTQICTASDPCYTQVCTNDNPCLDQDCDAGDPCLRFCDDDRPCLRFCDIDDPCLNHCTGILEYYRNDNYCCEVCYWIKVKEKEIRDAIAGLVDIDVELKEDALEELGDLWEGLKDLTGEDYARIGWDIFQQRLTEAKFLIDNPGVMGGPPTAATINTAINNLNYAYSNLVNIVQLRNALEALHDAIYINTRMGELIATHRTPTNNEMFEITRPEEHYTEASWETFKTRLMLQWDANQARWTSATIATRGIDAPYNDTTGNLMNHSARDFNGTVPTSAANTFAVTILNALDILDEIPVDDWQGVWTASPPFPVSSWDEAGLMGAYWEGNSKRSSDYSRASYNNLLIVLEKHSWITTVRGPVVMPSGGITLGQHMNIAEAEIRAAIRALVPLGLEETHNALLEELGAKLAALNQNYYTYDTWGIYAGKINAALNFLGVDYANIKELDEAGNLHGSVLVGLLERYLTVGELAELLAYFTDLHVRQHDGEVPCLPNSRICQVVAILASLEPHQISELTDSQLMSLLNAYLEKTFDELCIEIAVARESLSYIRKLQLVIETFKKFFWPHIGSFAETRWEELLATLWAEGSFMVEGDILNNVQSLPYLDGYGWTNETVEIRTKAIVVAMERLITQAFADYQFYEDTIEHMGLESDAINYSKRTWDALQEARASARGIQCSQSDNCPPAEVTCPEPGICCPEDSVPDHCPQAEYFPLGCKTQRCLSIVGELEAATKEIEDAFNDLAYLGSLREELGWFHDVLREQDYTKKSWGRYSNTVRVSLPNGEHLTTGARLREQVSGRPADSIKDKKWVEDKEIEIRAARFALVNAAAPNSMVWLDFLAARREAINVSSAPHDPMNYSVKSWDRLILAVKTATGAPCVPGVQCLPDRPCVPGVPCFPTVDPSNCIDCCANPYHPVNNPDGCQHRDYGATFPDEPSECWKNRHDCGYCGVAIRVITKELVAARFGRVSIVQLRAVTDEFNALNRDLYTEESWAAFGNVLNMLPLYGLSRTIGAMNPRAFLGAETRLANELAADLRRVMRENLITKAYSGYKGLINRIDSMYDDRADYTEATWTDLWNVKIVAALVENCPQCTGYLEIRSCLHIITVLERERDVMQVAMNHLVDIKDLAEAIRLANSYDEEVYRAETWAVLEEALESPVGRLAVDNVRQLREDQAWVDAKESAILRAVIGLVRKDQALKDDTLDDIEDILDGIKNLDKDDYTEDSWKDLEDAIKEAKKMLCVHECDEECSVPCTHNCGNRCGSDDLSHEDVKIRRDSLARARENLVSIVALKALIVRIERMGYREYDYTTASYRTLVDQTRAAKSLFQSGTRAQVNAMLVSLGDAESGLVSISMIVDDEDVNLRTLRVFAGRINRGGSKLSRWTIFENSVGSADAAINNGTREEVESAIAGLLGSMQDLSSPAGNKINMTFVYIAIGVLALAAVCFMAAGQMMNKARFVDEAGPKTRERMNLTRKPEKVKPMKPSRMKSSPMADAPPQVREEVISHQDPGMMGGG